MNPRIFGGSTPPKMPYLLQTQPNPQTLHRESDFSGSMPEKSPWLRRSQNLTQIALPKIHTKSSLFTKIRQIHPAVPDISPTKNSPQSTPKIRHLSTNQPPFSQKFSYQSHLKTPTNAAVMPNSRNCKKIPKISKNILKLFPKYGKI